MAKTRKQKKKTKPTAKFSCLACTKSKVERIKVSMAPFYNTYAEFCMETNLHGLRHTVDTKYHWLERLLWLTLTVSAFCAAVLCARNQLDRYNSEPVVVSMQRDFRRWRTSLPAVTACFSVKVDQEKAQAAILKYWNVTEESDPQKFQYYQEFIELVADVSFRTNLQNFWRFQSDDSLIGINLLQLALSVHPVNELQVETEHLEQQVVQWFPVMTEVGICQSFNSQYAQHQRMSPQLFELSQLPQLSELPKQLDSQHRQLTCHYHSERCYLRIHCHTHLVRYFIHSPHEISTAISNPTGVVEPGEEHILDFKEPVNLSSSVSNLCLQAVEIQASPRIRKLRPDQRRCRYPDEWISTSIRAYSFALCQMHCRSRMAVVMCGCRPYFHVKGDGELCDAQGMACISRHLEILINLPKHLAKCACLPQCEEINYYSHTKTFTIHDYAFEDGSTLGLEWELALKDSIGAGTLDSNNVIPTNMNSTDEHDNEDVSTLQINMLPPKFRLHRDILFTLEDLFASLGGTTALFIGGSVLTVVETVLFFIRRIIRFLVDCLTDSCVRKIRYRD